MVEAGTLATNADVAKKAGAFASATSVAEAYTNVYIKEAEGAICLITRYDWVTNIASVSTIGKEVLRDAVSAYAAVCVLQYNLSQLRTQESTTQINILWAQWRQIVDLLTKDNKYKEFILSGVGDID
jgi:hypothetical protein